MFSSYKNILVTGGAGFVGSHIVEKLLEKENYKVIIVDNMVRGSYQNMESFIDDERVEIIENDICNLVLMEKLIKKADYLFHLAALRITHCAADPKSAFDVMVKGTYDLFELSRKFYIKKIIFSSSASIYGMAHSFPTPESDNPYNDKTIYGGAKSYGESILRSFYDMYGLNYVALRYFNIYGPRMDTTGKYTEVIIRWLECIKNEKQPLIYGDGNISMDLINVEDVARANILAMESDISNEVFNIGSQTETTLIKLLSELLIINNSNLKPKFKDERIINSVKRRLADISKAKILLEFEPIIDLQKGLKELSHWYILR